MRDDPGPHGGALAAQALRDAGIDTVFAVPGGHVLHLLDGCLDADIRVIDTRHEGAAALAAEGWALATGRPGVAVVTAGPGFANAMIGLMDAGVWTVPLVLIGGRTGLDKQGRGAVMDVDQAAVAAPVAKRTIEVTDADRIPTAVAEAVHHARSGRPGPVYLEIPMDLYARHPAGADGRAGYEAPSVPQPEDGTIERALELLGSAQRPAIVAGSGAFWSDAGGALIRLVERAGIPITTTSAARGIVPDRHEWCLGTLVHGGGALLSADVVLIAGSAFDANLAFGREPLFNEGQQLIQIDIDPTRLGGNRRPDLAVVGDVAAVAQALTEGWTGDPDDNRSWLDRARETVGHLQAAWDRQIDEHDGAVIHAGAAMRTVAEVAREDLGDGVTFVTDGGDALAWGIAYAYAEGPGRLLTTTTALGTLGVGLPFALAAQAARPSERVLLFSGDGSFGLSAMELDTAVRHDLPVVSIVSNNAGWGDVSYEQDSWFGEGRRVASELRATRYDQLAESLGGYGEHVTALSELRPALRRALDSGAPAVVNVETDPGVLSDLLRNVGSLGVM